MVKGLFDTNRDTIARTKNLTCACAGVGNQTGDQRYLWPLSAMFFRYFFFIEEILYLYKHTCCRDYSNLSNYFQK